MEQFSPENFPEAVAELPGIVKSMKSTSDYFRRDIILSYLKDHSIRTEWIAANPQVASIMTSGEFHGANLEKLFESCRWNKSFRKDLETYVRSHLTAADC